MTPPGASGALHPIIRAAGADAELPSWARLDEGRMEHALRVADLLERWAREAETSETDRVRWRAAGLLHDALKGVPPAELRELAPGPWPDPVVHGPACARRLEAAGVEDPPLLLAIAHHTTGHPELGRLGEALYLADYLDPGRRADPERRAELRRLLPEEHDRVLVEVAAAKIGTLLERRLQIPDVTIEFWNALMERAGSA